MSVDPAAPVECLHVLPSFDPGGVPLRTVRIINHLGKRYRHRVVALDNAYGAAKQFMPDIDVSIFPPRRIIHGAVRGALVAGWVLRRLRPNLLITYNWGAIEWVIASRFVPVAGHIHQEDGFGTDEADTQIRRRVLCRRWSLAGRTRTVVPSRRLENLARCVWKLPPEAVTYLPNGVDVARFAAPARDMIRGFVRRPGELVVGTVAPLRPEKNIGRLLRAFAALDGLVPLRLVVSGDGTERRPLARMANDLGIADCVLFTGQVMPETVLGSFDIFALSSDTEQMPIALLEAMAASRAVVAVDVGDVKAIVCQENREFIVPRDDPAALAAALRRLLGEGATRARLGRSNRERAVAEFTEERMFAAYARLFAGAGATPGMAAPDAAV